MDKEKAIRRLKEMIESGDLSQDTIKMIVEVEEELSKGGGGSDAAAQQMLADLMENADENYDTFKEISDWIASAETSYMVKGTDYVTAGQKANTTLGTKATAEGNDTTASGASAHAEGDNTSAEGDYSHAEGYHTIAPDTCLYSHAEGYYTNAAGSASHAEGKGGENITLPNNTTAKGGSAYSTASHVEGYNCYAGSTTATGSAHAEGYMTIAYGGGANHSEGYQTKATANGAHAE